MTSTHNGNLVDAWRGQPAPLLPLLHAFHDRDRFLSDDAIREVAEGLNIPLAELFGTVTFYHHFARGRPGQSAPRVCTGPVCCLRGAGGLVESLDGAAPMPCSGRCDEPVPVLVGNRTLVGSPDGTLRELPSPMPAPNPGGCEECVFAGIRLPGRAGIEGYRASGGYEALERALGGMSPEELLDLIADSGLAGRGGAGFPTGQKWRAVAEAPGSPKTVVCNADEGEPGCFKDRALLDYDPHAVIEGMLLAAYASGAERGFIYLRYEYPETCEILERAIAEAEAADLLGADILGSGFEFRLFLRRGAGAYICGEEGSLLNSLEGRHPFPRNRPPFPVTHGYEDLPTVVNNVETLASAPPVVRNGAAWYRGLGLGEHAGTKLISLSGDIERPGNYEVPLGLPLPTLLHDWAGGAPGRAGDPGGDHGRPLRRLPRRRRPRRHPRRTGHSLPRLLPRGRRHHGLRRQPRHGRGRARGHGVLRRGIVRQVLPLPHRHAAADRAPRRDPRVAAKTGSLAPRGRGDGGGDGGDKRLRPGHRGPQHHAKSDEVLSRRSGKTRARLRRVTGAPDNDDDDST